MIIRNLIITPQLSMFKLRKMNVLFQVSEVKGPGDRLSVKQILWLDYLVNFGIKAETCYVRGECFSVYEDITQQNIAVKDLLLISFQCLIKYIFYFLCLSLFFKLIKFVSNLY